MEPDHKELLIGLLGSTYGEMKKLDDSITGSSSTLARRSDKVKQELTNILKNIAPPQDVPALQRINPAINQQMYQQPEPQLAPVVVQPAPTTIQQELPPQLVSDPGQLEFDLNRVTKYDDIMNYLYTITDKLNKIEDKIDKIVKSDDLPKKKVNQPQQSNSGLVQY